MTRLHIVAFTKSPFLEQGLHQVSGDKFSGAMLMIQARFGFNVENRLRDSLLKVESKCLVRNTGLAMMKARMTLQVNRDCDFDARPMLSFVVSVV